MEPGTLWHNPRCSKSRAALATLRNAGLEPTLRRYLEDPPTRAEMEALVDGFEGDPLQLVRREGPGEELHARDEATSRDVVELLVDRPALTQRPLLVREGRTLLVRGPAALDEAVRPAHTP